MFYIKKIINFINLINKNKKIINYYIYIVVCVFIFIFNFYNEIINTIIYKNYFNNTSKYKEIENFLNKLRIKYQSDYVAIDLFNNLNISEKDATFSRTFESYSTSVSPSKYIIKDYPLRAYENDFNILLLNNYIYVDDTYNCSEMLCNSMKDRNIYSFIMIPIYKDNIIIGTLNIEWKNKYTIKVSELNNLLNEKIFIENYFK